MPYACRNLGHHRGRGGHGCQPRRQDDFVQEGFSNEPGVEGNNNGEHNGGAELHFINDAYKICEQSNRQYDYGMGFTPNERDIKTTCILREK